MDSFDPQNASDESLLRLVAQGDTEARLALGQRLQKLRWIGEDDDAETLIEALKALAPDSTIGPDLVRETD